MKKYQASEELSNILFNAKFIDSTSLRDRKKGKRSFRRSKNSKKELFFDYININVIHSGCKIDLGPEISEKELRCILLYFALSLRDYKLINPSGNFVLNETLDAIEKFKMKQHECKIHLLPERWKTKLKILDLYNQQHIIE